MFNYVCHAIYYLESLFGKIISIKTNIFFQKKIKTLKGIIFFNNGLSVKLNIKVIRVIEIAIKLIKIIHK